ncbi:MAG: group III truncated hemoglobin [Rhizobiales bacterium]|nr:group III truncated hemoglobin [Hyphomicrobiales bacterium]
MQAIASGYEHYDDVGMSLPVVRSVIVAFYAKVRRDPVLGPVYVTRLDRSYNARDFMPAHIKHPTIQAELLPIWLRLFRQTAKELCTTEIADALIDIAERMAVSIEMSLTRRDNGEDTTPGQAFQRHRAL